MQPFVPEPVLEGRIVDVQPCEQNFAARSRFDGHEIAIEFERFFRYAQGVEGRPT